MANGTATGSDTSVLEDCIQMMRECSGKCNDMKNRASNPAVKAVLTCCAACCDAMARSCEEVRGTI
jgi:hypothetical protein